MLDRVDISFCDMPCEGGDRCLAQSMLDALLRAKQLVGVSLDDMYNLSLFRRERSRTFHFPALECVGSEPRLAILGITKGRTQVELALQYSFMETWELDDISVDKVACLVRERGTHAVFAGKQIRRNIGRLFQVIGAWEALAVPYDEENPDESVNVLIGQPNEEAHDAVYIASLVKCALLTHDGKSDAPSASEIINSSGAQACIRRNLFLPFDIYPTLRVAVLFGKTNWEVVQSFTIGQRSLAEEFGHRGVRLIFLPHPSGVNNVGIRRYCAGESLGDWCTTAEMARVICHNVVPTGNA